MVQSALYLGRQALAKRRNIFLYPTQDKVTRIADPTMVCGMDIDRQQPLHPLPPISEPIASGVQDAYSAMSTYLNRTPDNEYVVFEILTSRLKKLLADYGESDAIVDDTAALRQSTRSPPCSDTLDHLARVQAMSTYLILMLFNGDDHLRHTAEKQIPVLDAWMREMVQTARTDMLAQSSVNPFDKDALWRAWILAESLRRTWIVGRTIAAQYEMLKAGAPVPSACKGGMAFTTRKGAWEAGSAEEWEGMAAEVNFGLLQIGDARRWVQWGGISTGEVNSFASIFLE